MSSMYPSFGGAAVRPCMRCGNPLAPNESQCSRCGTFNPQPQGQGFGMGQQASPSGSAWGGQVPQSPQFPQNGNGAWPNSTGSLGQAGGWPQNTLFPTQNGSPSQPLQQGLFPQNGAGFSNPNQSALNNAFAKFQQNPNATNNFFANPQQKGYGASPLGTMNPPMRRGYRPNEDEEENSKRPSGAVIAVIIVLVLALIGGGGFAYLKIFKNHGSTANTANTATTPVTITTPTGTPLFSDSFKDNSTQWNLNSPTGTKSTISGGKLVLQLDPTNNSLLPAILPGKTFADFRVDVDAGLTSGDPSNGYGVYIRAASTQDSPLGLYYRFEVYGNGAFVVYKGTADKSGNTQSNNISDVKKDTNSAILPSGQGKLNHLTIIAKGAKLDFIINGVNVVSLTDVDPVYKSGSVALFVSQVQASHSGAEATFQNLAIFPAQ